MAEQPLIDIAPDQWEIVCGILRQHVPQHEVWAFGSRAKWTAKPYSDLDLAVITEKPLSLDVSAALSDAFSDSDLPWRVDVVDWATTSESFRKIIEKDKVVVQKVNKNNNFGVSSEWPTVLIDQVCELIVDCVNKTAPIVEQPTPYRMIRTTNIRNGRIDLSSCRFVDEATYTKWTRRAALQYGDVLLTREAPIGEVGLVEIPNGLFLGQRVMQYRADQKLLSPRFLLYAFLSPTLQDQFASHEGSGSVVSHIRVGDCFKFKLKLPPLPVQTEIAALLGALDDRIALLRETNATLEAIAQALFKSWFVDFDPVRAKMEGRVPEGMDEATAALFPDSFEESELGLVPKGWRVGTLGDIAQTVRKQLQPTDLHAELNYVGLEHIPRKSLSLDRWGAADGLESAKAVFGDGDILFGKLRPYFHKVVVAPFDGVCSTDILVCQSKNPVYYGFAVMQLFGAALIDYAERLSNGAKMPRVGWRDISAYPLVIPSESIADKYTLVINSMLARMKLNVHESQTLATLRDTLLPRLISGQLRLPDVESATLTNAEL